MYMNTNNNRKVDKNTLRQRIIEFIDTWTNTSNMKQTDIYIRVCNDILKRMEYTFVRNKLTTKSEIDKIRTYIYKLSDIENMPVNNFIKIIETLTCIEKAGKMVLQKESLNTTDMNHIKELLRELDLINIYEVSQIYEFCEGQYKLISLLNNIIRNN